MTTIVKVTAEDTAGGNKVRVEIVDPFSKVPHGYPAVELAEGESTSQVLHQGQSIAVSEIQAEPAPVPAPAYASVEEVVEKLSKPNTASKKRS